MRCMLIGYYAMLRMLIKVLVKTHLIKRHGRWPSDAVYLYMVDDIHEKLGVSRMVAGM